MGIKKAVFPVAGNGLRFLPATKANPKEMLPIVDKPLIQYAVEEAVRAGITHMIFIINAEKQVIKDHFDNNIELEQLLTTQKKYHLLKLVEEVTPQQIQFTYINQKKPLGLGHAILCAEQCVSNEPFAVILPDDLIDDITHPCLSDMISEYKKTGYSIVAMQPTPWEKVHQYGVIQLQHPLNQSSPISSIIEKPSRESAPSNLVAIGRYIFTPTIFSRLKTVQPDHHNEIQLTDGISQLIAHEQVYGWRYQGKRFDCGDKLGYLKATVEKGLLHHEIGAEFEEYLTSLINKPVYI